MDLASCIASRVGCGTGLTVSCGDRVVGQADFGVFARGRGGDSIVAGHRGYPRQESGWGLVLVSQGLFWCQFHEL